MKNKMWVGVLVCVTVSGCAAVNDQLQAMAANANNRNNQQQTEVAYGDWVYHEDEIVILGKKRWLEAKPSKATGQWADRISFRIQCNDHDVKSDPARAAKAHLIFGKDVSAVDVSFRFDSGATIQTSDMEYSKSREAIGYWSTVKTIPFMEQWFGAQQVTITFDPKQDSKRYWDKQKTENPYVKVPADVYGTGPVEAVFPIAGLQAPFSRMLRECGLDYGR